ncbi:MAG: YihA family ribosome biogenesis GTP-binding protein [Proteobacteria bacterium]|nr:YihA family ribosome biogenesis GTP-binding protein [Pseudomonadota bacterium]
MKIVTAEYLKSYLSIYDFDHPVLPVVAFIGRSNVGKSSLINHLLGRKKLVKTSSTPGKTQMINFFLINGSSYFVDLPGYGFANVPVKLKQNWLHMMQEFLFNCRELRLIVQLVDSRHKPNRNDLDFQKLLTDNRLPNLVVANKADKIKKSQMQKTLKEIRKELDLQRTPVLHSALKKTGKETIWEIIDAHLADV